MVSGNSVQFGNGSAAVTSYNLSQAITAVTAIISGKATLEGQILEVRIPAIDTHWYIRKRIEHLRTTDALG